MEKDRLIEIIRTGAYTEAHLEELGELVHTYPWFGLPRFMKLKVYEQTGKSPGTAELNSTVVFSSDRKHLYKWVTGAFDSMIGTSGLGATELEFLDSDGEEDAGEETGDEAEDEEGDEDPFVLLDDDTDNEDDADTRPIPEKDESEMEEPEMEEPESIPVMDPLDDEDDEEGEYNEPDNAGQTKEVTTMVEKPGTPAGETAGDKAEVPGTANGDAAGETAGKARTTGWADQPPVISDDQANRPSSRMLLDETVQMRGQHATRANPSTDLIERFLEREPGVIRADQQTNLEGDVSVGSVKEDDGLITDTLAKIYVKQGLHAKAIYAYERLSLKYPEKSAYFAAQIDKIKNNANV